MIPVTHESLDDLKRRDDAQKAEWQRLVASLNRAADEAPDAEVAVSDDALLWLDELTQTHAALEAVCAPHVDPLLMTTTPLMTMRG